ncbi:sigma 54-interacting transcriptional regulator [Clostridium sp. LY3-2]|uniref:sigma-54-dependent Fis family transcriptional regulator n=1 Tax=Clostridium sp. LY3-2 TaxID=2942482 RepID=UPI0021535FA7|nr:sigma 54-interacting transcriptional regulator [Clostridium sp. LY3-2]MCR6514238.1 sigma 54-interacting transcriptional regulator [Clostridium sp. LY3-2]
MDSESNNIIEKSHKRSEKYGVNREWVSSKKVLDVSKINLVLKENQDLVKKAKVYMDMFNDVLKDENFIIILTDKDGCILNIAGATGAIQAFERLNIKVGMYMDEKSIGTNAMGIAIEEDRAVQVTAEEHYINIFQTLTCSAAPIHGKDGEIIGSLNLTAQWTEKHPHSLGLVIFGVKAIENELDKIHSKEILDKTYNYMGSIMDNTDKGLILINDFGKIKKVNKLALEILCGDEKKLIGKRIANIIPNWENIINGFRTNLYNVYTKDIKLNFDNSHKTLIVVKPIILKEKLIGAIVTLSKEEDEYKNNNTGAYKSFDDIIGESDAICNVITNCKVIANSPSTILIQGESGTGKEVFAQAIHNYSYRRDKKFVPVNCGAIPKSLIESELFGYEEGAFTGAKKGGKQGKFEQADGGTIFLDEIGEMPIEMQVHLLRVIQEGRVTRVGSDREIPVDVRIIAATNKNLKEEVRNKRFREDLYYRLSVIPITLPPLRERLGDISRLIDHFFLMKSLKLNKPNLILDESIKEKLLKYKWPGNIRELENCIENIVNLDGCMSYDILNKKDFIYDDIVKNKTNDGEKIIKIDLEKYKSMKEIERDIIIKAIDYNNNNISKTAKELGMSRNTLYYKSK